MNKRMKNPYFWIGIMGVVLTAMGISPETLTHWSVQKDGMMETLSNPFMLGSIAVTVLGIFVDPTTKGLGDKK